MEEEKHGTEGNHGSKEDRLGGLREFLAQDERDLSPAELEKIQEIQEAQNPPPPKNYAALVMFIVGICAILGILGFVLVDNSARERVVGFFQGKLFEMDRIKIEKREESYREQINKIAAKVGSVTLVYEPKNAKVQVIQRYFKLDDVSDKSPEEWGTPRSIDNPSLSDETRGDGLEFLTLEDLPIRERGLVCRKDGQFYPESWGFCPGFEKCKAELAAVKKEAEKAEKAAEGEASEGEAKEAKKPKMSDECETAQLKPAQLCPLEKTQPGGQTYFLEIAEVSGLCPDNKTLTDPAAAPIFISRYDFLFEAPGFVPQVMSYTEDQWLSLGRGKYTIQWSPAFALQPTYSVLKARFEKTYQQLKCWEREWALQWGDEGSLMRSDVARVRMTAAYKEKWATAVAEKDKTKAPFKNIREQSMATVTTIDSLFELKRFATVKENSSLMYAYCPEANKCDPKKMDELAVSFGSKTPDHSDLNPVGKAVYFGLPAIMGHKGFPGMDAYYADKPIEKAAVVCLQKMPPLTKDATFLPVTDKDCIAAIEGLRAIDENAMNVLKSMFIDQTIGKQIVEKNKADVDNYLLPAAEYKNESEPYENLVARMENEGKFVKYVVDVHMYAPDLVDTILTKYAESRQANHKADCDKRKVVATESYGRKAALEIAWSTGSELVYRRWFDKLFEIDIQGVLVFCQDHGDQAKYDYAYGYFQSRINEEKAFKTAKYDFQKNFHVNVTRFRALREELTKANADAAANRKAFQTTYDAKTLESMKTADPDKWLGYLMIADPKAGEDELAKRAALPLNPVTNAPIGADGDQAEFHKVVFYHSIFAPDKFLAERTALKARMAPFFMTREAYDKLTEEKPDLPPYDVAVGSLLANGVHLKYFWLVALIDTPDVLKAELDAIPSLELVFEVARFVDPARFTYLVDLNWFKEGVDIYSRTDDVVMPLSQGLQTSWELYTHEQEKLTAWAKSRSIVLKAYNRRVLAESFLQEPDNAQAALDKSLKAQDKMFQLDTALLDARSVEQTAVMETIMSGEGELGAELKAERQASAETKHGFPHNETIRMKSGFKTQEFDRLQRELKSSKEYAKVYAAIVEENKYKRFDCRTIEIPLPEGWEAYLKEQKGPAASAPKTEKPADAKQEDKPADASKDAKPETKPAQ